MNKSTIIKIIISFFVGFILAMFISIINDNKKQKEFDNLEVMYKIKIENEYINVRKNPTTGSDKIYEVLQNEKYEVIDVFTDSKYYNWYKIKFGLRRTGWVASDKEEPWVTIIER